MPDQRWSEIRGMGNIGFEIVWEVVCRDLPGLKATVEQALSRLESRRNDS